MANTNLHLRPNIRVAIIEDEFFAAQHLKQLLTELEFEVVGLYHSGEDFFAKTQWQFDAAIIDIMLAGHLNGLNVAKELKAQQKPFIFLTANQDVRTLKEAARLTPTAYISKPFKANDVAAALEIIAHQKPPMLQIRSSNGVEELSPNDVVYIKSDGVYIEIHTEKSMVVQRKLLREIEIELPDNFVRIHRSYLVNRHFIQSKTAQHVVANGEELPISRSYKGNLG